MPDTRLEQRIDGRLQASELAPPLLSSAHAAWAGFPMERNRFPRRCVDSIYYQHSEVVLVTAGAVSIRYRDVSGETRFVAGPGSVTLWPAGRESRPMSWRSPYPDGATTEVLKVHLGRSVLARLTPDADPVAGLSLTPQTGIEDSTLAALMRLMEADVAAGCPTGSLYGESLSLALAAHVAGRYATRPIDAPLREGLARPALARVLDYIDAHLGRDLTIAELAGVANMSPHHFSLRFKQSAGVAPHQWVTRARVREAERRLRAHDMSVTQVGLSLGFSSQSHFTEVFRRLTGTTPRRYQQQRSR